MLAEEEIDRSPMERTSPPFVPEKAVSVLSIEQMRALLDSCKGRELVPLRDTAIIRLLLDSGGRLGEVAALAVDDLDFDMDVAHAIGKGRRLRALPFDGKTGAAVGRYLRKRALDKQAHRRELWLAEKGKGPLLAGGIKQMLKRRGKARPHFRRVVEALALRYGAVDVYVDHTVRSACGKPCREAEGDDCTCSCLGDNHGAYSWRREWRKVSEHWVVRRHYRVIAEQVGAAPVVPSPRVPSSQSRPAWS